MNNFAKGILFGLGFGLGLVIIALIVIGILFLSPLKFGDSPNSIVGTDAIIINEHRLEFIDGKPMIYGSLTNSTNKKLSSIMIEGGLFLNCQHQNGERSKQVFHAAFFHSI